jgi:glycosyltransferase involved in cell wall biosynthesis
MKVLHVMPSIHPRLGGPSSVIIPMMSSLFELGIEVHLATTVSRGLPTPKTPFPVTLCQPLPFSRKEFIPSFELFSWLKKNIKDFDLVHCHFLFTFSTTAAAWLCRKNKVPYIIRPLGHYAPWSLDQHSIKKQLYLSAIEKKTLAGASAFHATSVGEAEALRQLLPSPRVVTIPLGVSHSDFPNEQEQDSYSGSFVILVLGRIHPKKRIELLLKSLKHYKSINNVRIKVLLAGDGNTEYLDSLKALAGEISDPLSVDFLGYVEGATKARLLRRADLAICLSHHENFAVAVAESIAVGCPVVVTEGVQIAPLIERYQCGKVVEDNEAAVVEAVRYYTCNPDLRKEHGRNGAKLALDEFSWPKIGAQLEAAYRSVVSHYQVRIKEPRE